ncbi:Fibronectin (Fragments) [Geodia barretti]|nr:Fibronectin (Fragments) [Geodia barretti]
MALLVALIVTGLFYWRITTVEGVTFSFHGSSIRNDNQGRISVYDFEVVGESDFSSALKCTSEKTIGSVPSPSAGRGTLYQDRDNPRCCYAGLNDLDRLGGITLGWSGNTANEDNRRVYYLSRRSHNPEEGYFTCFIPNDNRNQRGLYILYPITAVTAAIEVETGSSTFRVRCTSTGGRALNMTVSGPNGYNYDLRNIEPLGTRRYLGGDSYTATTEVMSNGKDGDAYKCNVTSFSSNISTVTVRVLAPIITSLELRAATSVRVQWTRPELSVTGYIVHYTLAGGIGNDGTQTVSAGSTGTDITGLTGGQTYIVTVEVTSNSPNILPGISEGKNITLPPGIPKDVKTNFDSSASVAVSWQAVDDADSYTVTFSQMQGADQQGLCPTDSHTATLTVSAPSTTVSIAVGGDVASTVTDMLRAYTTYEVTVEAVSDVRGTSQLSETRRVLTPQMSAGEALGNVRAKAESSTEISVQWSGLSNCRLVNGHIVSFRVQFATGSTADKVMGEGNDGNQWWWSGGEIILTGLTPRTKYSISVAAVNENGDTGVYSDPIEITTPDCKLLQ